MNIIPVQDLDARCERLKKDRQSNHAFTLFNAHLHGLRDCSGERILEIGGRELYHMRVYFVQSGAEYTTVRLEKDLEQRPWIITGDFLTLPDRAAYDCIISMGVFEPFGFGINTEEQHPFFGSAYINHPQCLRKLFSLTQEGGFNVIGTISHPCMFTEHEIRDAGFDLCYRTSPFHSLHLGEINYDPHDTSELLIIQKPEQKEKKQGGKNDRQKTNES